MTMNSPRVGIVADDTLCLHQLQTLLGSAGYRVLASMRSDQVDHERVLKQSVDVWVVELATESNESIDILYDLATVPILMGDGIPAASEPNEHERWQVRLKKKLMQMVDSGLIQVGSDQGNPIIQQARATANDSRSAIYVWVLGASMGGPEAVKEFLDCLPVNLPVAFIYAQHIDDDNDGLLARVLGRHNRLQLNACGENHALLHGQVSIVPTDHAIRFLPLGKIRHLEESWQGHFCPNIDQVIEDIAKLYKENSGVIIFSGMSDDGAKGVKVMRENGGTVWAQDADSCVCSSMPDAAMETGAVTLTGTPSAMADALMKKFASEYIMASN